MNHHRPQWEPERYPSDARLVSSPHRAEGPDSSALAPAQPGLLAASLSDSLPSDQQLVSARGLAGVRKGL